MERARPAAPSTATEEECRCASHIFPLKTGSPPVKPSDSATREPFSPHERRDVILFFICRCLGGYIVSKSWKGKVRGLPHFVSPKATSSFPCEADFCPLGRSRLRHSPHTPPTKHGSMINLVFKNVVTGLPFFPPEENARLVCPFAPASSQTGFPTDGLFPPFCVTGLTAPIP